MLRFFWDTLYVIIFLIKIDLKCIEKDNYELNNYGSKTNSIEREKTNVFKWGFSPLMEIAGFTSCFSKVQTQHFAILSSQRYLPLLVQSVLAPTFSVSSSINSALFFQPFQNLSLFLTHHHYSSSKHVHTITLYLVWLKFLLNPANS